MAETDRAKGPRQMALGCRLHGFLRLSLNVRTILFRVILLDKTVSVGEDSLCIMTLASWPHQGRAAMVSLKCQEMSAAKSNGKPQFIRIYEQLAARKEGRKGDRYSGGF